MTKIKLEPPYSLIWKFGYLGVNSEGRRTVSLFNSRKDRSSCTYARYLMSCKLGRFLTKEEQVDHIDNDKTNDTIENLQILSVKENNIKSHKLSDVILFCPICGIEFTKTRSQLRGRNKEPFNRDMCCSRSCGAKKGHNKKF